MINNTVMFAFVAGLLSSLVFMGAKAWFKDLGLKMSWWKWLLAILWYILLNFFVFLDFTLIGEGETSATLRLVLFQSVVVIILGVGLIRILWSGRQKRH
jgi:hypothetical protein